MLALKLGAVLTHTHEARAVRVRAASHSASMDNSSSNHAHVTAPLCTSSVDHAYHKPVKYEILDRTDDDLCDYCARLPPSEDSDDCWKAWVYYHDKKSDASKACSTQSQRCDDVDSLVDLVQSTSGRNGFHNMVQCLLHMKDIEQPPSAAAATSAAAASETAKADAGTAGGMQSQHAQPSMGGTEHSMMGSTASYDIVLSMDLQDEGETWLTLDADTLRDRSVRLFHAIDRNSNGVLDMSEFRHAMELLGDRLSGTVVECIGECMDVHGHVTLDDFLAIIEAERVRAHTQYSEVLRTITHHDRPAWFSSRPRCLESM